MLYFPLLPEKEDHFVVSVMQPMMADDAKATSRAITTNVTHPDEINQAFSDPVYSKVCGCNMPIYLG